MGTSICLIDEQGDIVLANDSSGHVANTGAGEAPRLTIDEYILRICDAVAHESDDGVAFITEGIRSVVNGERADFNFRYSYHTFAEERWLDGTVRRIGLDGGAKVLITHSALKVRLRPVGWLMGKSYLSEGRRRKIM